MPAASPPRRLNLVDGMILVAGMAACFLLTRYYLEEHYPNMVRRVGYSSGVNRFWLDGYLSECLKVGTLWLGFLSPLVLLVRLRRPRPDFPDLLHQPGTVAMGAATMIIGVAIGCWWLIALMTGQGFGSFLYRISFARVLTQTGATVTTVWIFMRLSSRWLPERSAIDLIGGLLGLCWIVAWLTDTAITLHQSAVLTAGGPATSSAFSFSNLIDH